MARLPFEARKAGFQAADTLGSSRSTQEATLAVGVFSFSHLERLLSRTLFQFLSFCVVDSGSLLYEAGPGSCLLGVLFRRYVPGGFRFKGKNYVFGSVSANITFGFVAAWMSFLVVCDNLVCVMLVSYAGNIFVHAIIFWNVGIFGMLMIFLYFFVVFFVVENDGKYHQEKYLGCSLTYTHLVKLSIFKLEREWKKVCEHDRGSRSRSFDASGSRNHYECNMLCSDIKQLSLLCYSVSVVQACPVVRLVLARQHGHFLDLPCCSV